MERIYHKGTDKIPYVNFDSEAGLIELKGRSIPEDAESLYLPMIEWVDAYIPLAKGPTKANFEFEYFNTSSSKWLLTLFKKLDDLYEKTKDLEINWYYSDDDLLEYGELLEEIVEIPVNLIDIE